MQSIHRSHRVPNGYQWPHGPCSTSDVSADFSWRGSEMWRSATGELGHQTVFCAAIPLIFTYKSRFLNWKKKLCFYFDLFCPPEETYSELAIVPLRYDQVVCRSCKFDSRRDDHRDYRQYGLRLAGNGDIQPQQRLGSMISLHQTFFSFFLNLLHVPPEADVNWEQRSSAC